MGLIKKIKSWFTPKQKVEININNNLPPNGLAPAPINTFNNQTKPMAPKTTKTGPNIRLLTINSEEKSAKKLGFPVQTFFSGHKESFDNDIVVRWGYGFSIATADKIFCDNPDFKNVINPEESIKLNVEKIKSIQVLSRVVPTPKIYLDKVPAGVQVVYRPKNHAGGVGFELRRGPFDLDGNHYATQYIPTNREIRVFVCGQRTLTCSRIKPANVASDICRSLYGYGRWCKTPANLHRMALKAAKALGLQIGAFDILAKGNKYYFLEFNTGPTIEGKVRQFYQNGIPALAKKMYPKLFKKSKKLSTKKYDNKATNRPFTLSSWNH